MSDEYSHSDYEVFYVEENILGPVEKSNEYESLTEKLNSLLTHNCKCRGNCEEDSCYCLKISGGANYISFLEETSSKDLCILNKKKNYKEFPFIECNELCQCSMQCGNRLVQNGPVKNLFVEICTNELKGLGLFTNNFILKGTFICEYAGEIITNSQASYRHNLNQTHNKMNYIFCLQEHINEKTIQTFVDPSNFGNIGRYINHSCEPNSEILPVRINSPIPKLSIFSSTDIFPGNEITIDYGENTQNNTLTTIKQRKHCLCKSSKCRNLMPFDIYCTL